MRLLKITILLSAVLFFASCKKTVDKKSNEENHCINTRNVSINGTVIEGQYIVLYKSPGNPSSVSAGRVSQMNRDLLQEKQISASAIKASFTGHAGGFVAELTPEQAADLKADPSIDKVEPDRIIALSNCFTIVAPTLITWNVNKVGYGDGTGKTAWIIDSGIDFEHTDLNVDQARSKSFISGVTSADDENGHGTHVAGIIGAKNNTFGTLGVASGANLVALKVLDKDGKGTLSSIIQALSYINTYAKAGDVVNMSLGEEEVSEILDQQVQATAARGILVAIAAGNDAKAANLYSPGRANGSNIFTVSATDSLDNFASFSNYGNDVVDYAAPGVRILSTYTEGRYARMSGTSMAAPHLAGLLLLNGRNINYSGTALNDPDGTPDKIARK